MLEYPQDKTCALFLKGLPKKIRPAAHRNVPLCASCRSREFGTGGEDGEECLFEGPYFTSHLLAGSLTRTQAFECSCIILHQMVDGRSSLEPMARAHPSI